MIKWLIVWYGDMLFQIVCFENLIVFCECYWWFDVVNIWVKVFKNGASKIRGRQPPKKFEVIWFASADYITSSFLKAVFHKFYLLHFWIPWLLSISSNYDSLIPIIGDWGAVFLSISVFCLSSKHSCYKTLPSIYVCLIVSSFLFKLWLYIRLNLGYIIELLPLVFLFYSYN